jgi:hypothetical protein
MNLNLLMTAGSVGLLLAGRKLSALAMFARGAWGLEQEWRAKNPEVASGFGARWDASTKFYEQTHQNPTNRLLHVIGIPMIVGGTLGLFVSKPLRPIWVASVAAFGVGWALNLVGHAKYEKNKPAFADDPLSVLAGPVWDFKQIFSRKGEAAEATPEVNITYTNGAVSELQHLTKPQYALLVIWGIDTLNLNQFSQLQKSPKKPNHAPTIKLSHRQRSAASPVRVEPDNTLTKQPNDDLLLAWLLGC